MIKKLLILIGILGVVSATSLRGAEANCPIQTGDGRKLCVEYSDEIIAYEEFGRERIPIYCITAITVINPKQNKYQTSYRGKDRNGIAVSRTEASPDNPAKEADAELPHDCLNDVTLSLSQ